MQFNSITLFHCFWLTLLELYELFVFSRSIDKKKITNLKKKCWYKIVKKSTPRGTASYVQLDKSKLLYILYQIRKS